jgi:DNA-3-methyladenine glycosylase
MPQLISSDFFARPTLDVAPKLVGKIIEIGGCSGRIVEVEAYTDDPASHGHTRTTRSAIMHDTFGHVYIYFIYGMYYCLNFTTERDQVGAVLIRAVEPLRGIEAMQKRRGVTDVHRLCNGPGKLCEAFGIDLHYNHTLIGDKVKLYAGRAGEIQSGPRIGISKATDLNWRFFEVGNPFVRGGAKSEIRNPKSK